MYGPVAGGLIGFIGHTLGDLSWGGSPWWSWVIGFRAMVGVIVGLVSKKIDLSRTAASARRKCITFAHDQRLVANGDQPGSWWLPCWIS